MISMRSVIVASFAMLAITVVHADDGTRHWIARVGVHPFTPQPNSHTELEFGNGVSGSLSTTYLFTRHWALEVFAAAPIKLEFDVAEVASGSVRLMPAALTAQYHVSDARDRLRVYAGIGVGYANITREHTRDAWSNEGLDLHASAGLAGAIGLDMNMGRRWFANIDVRWFDMDSSSSLNGSSLGRVEFDPFALGLSVGRRLR